MEEPVSIGITPDHGTPCEIRTQVQDPVPFAIYKPGNKGDSVLTYNEKSTEKGSLGLIKGNTFIKTLLNR